MKNKIIILLTALTISGVGFAQLGTPMSQFSGNQIAYNPGYAGIRDILSVNLTIHQSWISILNAPFMVNFNAHSPIGNRYHSAGLIIQSETYGALSGNFIKGNYSHRVDLGGHRVLSLGLQAGLMIHTIDWDKPFYIEHPFPLDPTLLTGRTSEVKFDVSTGAVYLTPKGYAGLSVLHLTNPKYGKVKIEEKEWFSRLRSQFVAIAGYNIKVDHIWSLRPELFMRYVHTTPLSTNVGMHAHYQGKHSFGINYMSGQNGISFQARTLLTPSLRVGYSYDTHLGTIKRYQSGSHEISVNYMIPLPEHKARTVDLLWL
jgi:type IX secretion system PorP/SprF family membrane protein